MGNLPTGAKTLSYPSRPFHTFAWTFAPRIETKKAFPQGQTRSSVPRAAFSHSASVGSRLFAHFRVRFRSGPRNTHNGIVRLGLRYVGPIAQTDVLAVTDRCVLASLSAIRQPEGKIFRVCDLVFVDVISIKRNLVRGFRADSACIAAPS